MACECCQSARTNPQYSVHCPSCLPCGARLIQNIQRLPIARSIASARCKTVLADWVAHGHSEIEIRRIAKADAVPLQPEVIPRKKGRNER